MIRGPRTMVLGLDGVPFSLLTELFAAGIMPRLSEIATRGAFLRMTTDLPAVSSVAWTSFMTGANPGIHGIYGFTDLADREIALRLPSFDDIRCPVIWNRLKEKRSLIVNLPFTYPAGPLNGVLIAGFVAPLLDRAVYPSTLVPWLRSLNYEIDVDCVRGRGDRRSLVNEMFAAVDKRERVMLALLDGEAWDLFIGVITETDRLHHFFFDAYGNPGHPFHRDFIDFYRRVDASIGRLLDHVGPYGRVIVLSDHGFTHLKKQVSVNHILRSLGYLHYTRPDPQSLGDVDSSSRAFAMDPARIYVNSKERFRNGRLNEEEARETRSRLKKELEELTLGDLGPQDETRGESVDDPVFREIRVREELYDGPCIGRAPDLVIIPREGYDLKAAVNVHKPVFTDIFTGMHTHDDAFLICDDPSVGERLPEPRIADVAGLILAEPA